MKKIAIITTLLATLVGAVKAEPKSSVELMTGDKSATLDVKLSGELTPNLSLFFRGRTTTNYQGEVSNFGLVDLQMNLGYGVGAFFETQAATLTGLNPRAGFSYSWQGEDFSTNLLATMGLEKDSNLEIHPIWNYRPKITEDLRLVMAGEDITRIEKAGHLYSVQRLRFGLEKDGFQIGPAVDFSEKGQKSELKFDCNIGGYFSKKF